MGVGIGAELGLGLSGGQVGGKERERGSLGSALISI